MFQSIRISQIATYGFAQLTSFKLTYIPEVSESFDQVEEQSSMPAELSGALIKKYEENRI